MAIWSRVFPVLCLLLLYTCAFTVASLCDLQALLRQPAEIQVSPWMVVATGKGGSLVTLWPSLVIRDMSCRGRAESPASKWKIDTTGNPALQAASVRAGKIVGVRVGGEYVKEMEQCMDSKGEGWRCSILEQIFKINKRIEMSEL